MPAGIEWLIDATGCPPETLQRLERLQVVCGQVIDDLSLCVVREPLWHKFPGAGGVTGLYLLGESHLACHTYPESGLATFNLYCCRARPEWPWSERLRSGLGAVEVRIQVVSRGQDLELSDGPRAAFEVAR